MNKELRNQAFTHLTLLRKKNITHLESVTEKQSHITPEKFSNNLYWQAGHILISQFSLVFKRCNLPIPLVDERYIRYFAKGTSPSDFDDQIPSYDKLLTELRESLAVLEKDIHSYPESTYDSPLQVSFGFTINSFHEAVIAIPYHEAYHMNAINLLLKQINN